MTSASESSFDLMLREAAELRVPTLDSVRLPEPGELLQEKYRIEEKLGEGGMGAVFRATHVENGKQVAVKWLLGRSVQAARRFLREAQVAAQIDHPNVVNVFDLGTHHGGRYLVMELLRGQSLGARMRGGRIEARELVELMIPVLRGVAAAHSAGVIHRDLKPDNVFLCVASDGSARGPKVLDFGISKLRSGSPLDERLTSEGSGLGTLAYMSPEQLVDAPNVDERTDIYAAGVMMYEALAGRLPFRAESYNALVLAIAAQLPLPISLLDPGVHPALEGIVMRAMAKDASSRQPSIQLLIQELEAWRSSAPQQLPYAANANANSEAPVRTFFGAKHWVRAAGFSLACLVLVLLVRERAHLDFASWLLGGAPSVQNLAKQHERRASSGAGEALSRAPVHAVRAEQVETTSAAAPGAASEFGTPVKPVAAKARLRTSPLSGAPLGTRSRAGTIQLSDL